jgi:hypothetical protein
MTNPGRRPIGSAVLASALAVGALFASAGPVAAECDAPPTPGSIGPYIGYAFTATVLSVSRDPTQRKPGDARFDWEVRLSVTHLYRGSVPDVFRVDGWDAGCSWFRSSGVSVGEKLFVSTGRMYLPTFSDNLLIWRWTGTAWTFDYETDIPSSGGNRGVFPPGVERASTTAQILDLVDPAHLPPTDAAGAVHQGADPGLAWLLAAPALAGFVAMWRRRNLRR